MSPLSISKRENDDYHLGQLFWPVSQIDIQRIMLGGSHIVKEKSALKKFQTTKRQSTNLVLIFALIIHPCFRKQKYPFRDGEEESS